MQTTVNANVIPRVALRIPLRHVELRGEASLREGRRGLVVLACGDGEHLYDRMNRDVARHLFDAGFATLVVELLTPNESAEDAETSALRFHQSLLASRIVEVVRWARRTPIFTGLRIGFVASGLCAGSVLAAAAVSTHIRAVVCCGPRLDLVLPRLERLRADVLLIAGERDTAHLGAVVRMRHALPATSQVTMLPGAGHVLDDAATLLRVAGEAEEWFSQSLEQVAFDSEREEGALVGIA